MITCSRTSDLSPGEVEKLSELKHDFPGWSPWRSDAGRWWATRHRQLSNAEDFNPGCYRTVDADDIEKLREAIKAKQAVA